MATNLFRQVEAVLTEGEGSMTAKDPNYGTFQRTPLPLNAHDQLSSDNLFDTGKRTSEQSDYNDNMNPTMRAKTNNLSNEIKYINHNDHNLAYLP